MNFLVLEPTGSIPIIQNPAVHSHFNPGHIITTFFNYLFLRVPLTSTLLFFLVFHISIFLRHVFQKVTAKFIRIVTCHSILHAKKLHQYPPCKIHASNTTLNNMFPITRCNTQIYVTKCIIYFIIIIITLL